MDGRNDNTQEAIKEARKIPNGAEDLRNHTCGRRLMAPRAVQDRSLTSRGINARDIIMYTRNGRKSDSLKRPVRYRLIIKTFGYLVVVVIKAGLTYGAGADGAKF